MFICEVVNAAGLLYLSDFVNGRSTVIDSKLRVGELHGPAGIAVFLAMTFERKPYRLARRNVRSGLPWDTILSDAFGKANLSSAIFSERLSCLMLASSIGTSLW